MRSKPSVTGTIDLDLPEFDTPPADPMPLVIEWADRVVKLGVIEPYNIAIATVGADGDVTNRFVLAKLFDLNGVVFATNSSSVKGHQLAENPRAAIVAYWRETRQQLRLTGPVELASKELSDEIWRDRPLQSQAGSAASKQSEPLPDDAAYHEEAERLAAPGIPLPRPDDWNGYRLRPTTVEFWHGAASRMHRRLRYELTDSGWRHERLYP
ncbi:MAG: pyridoxal 5'-phosphate synthase [Microbacteriaceae bacterium]|nr:pyridoxal 5'-phosphate synthase [Microbacteriaceae bacterium]